SVYDAGRPARWGTISWDADIPAGTRIELTTRSGNRPTPDTSWSAWSPPYSAEKGSPMSSPAARFVQWKAELSRLKTDATPVLRRVHVSLLPENRPPVLRGLKVLDPAKAVPRPATDKAAADATGDRTLGADKPAAERPPLDKPPSDKIEPPK